MSNFQIKEFTAQDYEQFHTVYTRILHEAFHEFSAKIKEYLSSKEKTRKRFDTPYKFGAFIENNLVGYVLLDKPSGGVSKIDWIGVLKDYQNNGIGTALITKAEEKAKELGVHNIQLVCDEHLVDFYKEKGYEVLGFDKKSYFGYDVYVMKKLLQEPNENAFLK